MTIEAPKEQMPAAMAASARASHSGRIGPNPSDDRAEGGRRESIAPLDTRRFRLAAAIVRIVSRLVDPHVLAIELHRPNGDRPVDPAAEPRGHGRATVTIAGPDALARLVWPPTPDTFAEGYLRGDLEIDGDIAAAVEAGQRIDLRRLPPTDARRLLRWSLELRRARSRAPLRRTVRLGGARHSRARDLAAVRFHYDVGEDFYGLWLDRRLTYSCAYFESAEDPELHLDEAQEAKLDLICRKLALAPGQRLLDIGCGWGSLIVYAAERYGAEAVGVTLSERQAAEANRRAAAQGLADRARAEVRDYRDLAALGEFDSVASVGMFEHVGAANLPTYFRAAFDATRPGGRFLNHGISTADRDAARFTPSRLNPLASRFVDRYVFPDGELLPVERAVAEARAAGFELLDVQSLRPHYALTLAAWVRRLEAHWSVAVAAAGDEVARTWRLYMAGARLGFERGSLDVDQLLLIRPQADSPAARPLRPGWWERP